MQAIVVGYGSIGSRHARILKGLGCQTAVVSSRPIQAETVYSSIEDAVRNMQPSYVVIASQTSRHSDDLQALASTGFAGTILLEKPLFREAADELPQLDDTVYVAYNLRFHPLVQRLRKVLLKESIISVYAYVGQYLPLWRPERDYRDTYSASKEAGGGVLRDLSHELDLLNWLLGGWKKLTALGGHFSRLEIDSDDVFGVMMTTCRCPIVTLQMNYLDRIGQRRIIINTEERTIEADFVAGHLINNGELEKFTIERDHSYQEMHSAMLENRKHDVCTYTEGLDVMRMISAAEKAVEEKRWLEK